MNPGAAASSQVTDRAWVWLFGAFAAAYFLSTLLRAVTATLAPEFSREFGLGAADLGLLSGAYFLGFSVMQLPLGAALDRWGARRVEVALVAVAAAGCLLFAQADAFATLAASRALIGVGVAACLMAPLTCYRLRFSKELQLRCNSWMLMVGSIGMVAATVPVQVTLPLLGWRGIFTGVAALLVLGALVLWLVVPDHDAGPGQPEAAGAGYLRIAAHPEFLRLAPLAFFVYGGMIAVQTLWAGPWLTRVSGWTPAEASRGLMVVNVAMLAAYAAWGALMPWLVRRGLHVRRLLAVGLPANLLLLGWNVAAGPSAVDWHWAAWCVTASQIALSQPALAQAFPAQVAGRALSAYNLVVFSGVFVVQWGLGVVIDAMRQLGLTEAVSYQVAMAVLLACCIASYAWFMLTGRWAAGRDNRVEANRP